MLRDDSALPHLHRAQNAAARWPLADFDQSLHAPSLVLFVGDGVRPERDGTELLGQVGLRCVTVSSLDAAHAACESLQFDALVIDAALLVPTLALGLVALQLNAQAALLVVAAQASEVDAIVALEHGAAHYLTRPLSPRLLRAHLVAQLRTRLAEPAAAPAVSATTSLAGWQLDSLQRELQRGTRRIELTEGQFSLLQCLAVQAGKVVPRTELEARVSHRDGLTARAVDVYVHRLRRRLVEAGVDDLDIEAVRGRGYRLTSPGHQRAT